MMDGSTRKSVAFKNKINLITNSGVLCQQEYQAEPLETHALIKDAKALKSLTQGVSKEVYFTGGDRCFSSMSFQGSREP